MGASASISRRLDALRRAVADNADERGAKAWTLFALYAAGTILGLAVLPFTAYLTAAEAQDPAHWARHMRSTVRFADGLTTLLADPNTVLVEVGPGKAMVSLARLHPAFGAARMAVATLSPNGARLTDPETLWSALGRLWCAGIEPDLTAWAANHSGRRVSLPGYAFDRTPYMLPEVRV